MLSRFSLSAAIVCAATMAYPEAHHAMDCTGLKPSVDGDADTAFLCLAHYQERLEALEAKMSRLIDANTGAPRLAEDHVHGHEHELPAHSHEQAALPSGAVVMFASGLANNETEPCPVGWSLLQEATGRMPIGAGQPSLKLSAEFVREFGKFDLLNTATGEVEQVNLRPHVRIDDEWQYYRLMEIGGAETVALKNDQMASHRHGMAMLSASNGQVMQWTHGGTTSNFPYFDIPSHGTIDNLEVSYQSAENGVTPSGGGHPHNNMPPYLALYFCKKT